MPLIIAHRGASAYTPENTIAAFELARQQGADMIELDVRRTVDGQLVVFHDETTERWNGQALPVARCTLAELQALDIGGERVPALEEALEFARATGMRLNIELKTADTVARCAELLYAFGLVGRVIVSSFSEAALRDLRAIAPAVPRAYLMGSRTFHPSVRARELWPFFALRAVEASAWHPYYDLPMLDRLIPLVCRAGYQVNVWTVDDPERMRALAALGVSGIITNRPDLARQVLRE